LLLSCAFVLAIGFWWSRAHPLYAAIQTGVAVGLLLLAAMSNHYSVRLPRLTFLLAAIVLMAHLTWTSIDLKTRSVSDLLRPPLRANSSMRLTFTPHCCHAGAFPLFFVR